MIPFIKVHDRTEDTRSVSGVSGMVLKKTRVDYTKSG